eukprot:12300626-Alexandrium_andersonii.AAC.1
MPCWAGDSGSEARPSRACSRPWPPLLPRFHVCWERLCAAGGQWRLWHRGKEPLADLLAVCLAL